MKKNLLFLCLLTAFFTLQSQITFSDFDFIDSKEIEECSYRYFSYNTYFFSFFKSEKFNSQYGSPQIISYWSNGLPKSKKIFTKNTNVELVQSFSKSGKILKMEKYDQKGSLLWLDIFIYNNCDSLQKRMKFNSIGELTDSDYYSYSDCVLKSKTSKFESNSEKNTFYLYDFFGRIKKDSSDFGISTCYLYSDTLLIGYKLFRYDTLIMEKIYDYDKISNLVLESEVHNCNENNCFDTLYLNRYDKYGNKLEHSSWYTSSKNTKKYYYSNSQLIGFEFYIDGELKQKSRISYEEDEKIKITKEINMDGEGFSLFVVEKIKYYDDQGNWEKIVIKENGRKKEMIVRSIKYR